MCGMLLSLPTTLTTHYPLLTTHYSLLTTHHSLLTTHYTPPTTHYTLHTTRNKLGHYLEHSISTKNGPAPYSTVVCVADIT